MNDPPAAAPKAQILRSCLLLASRCSHLYDVEARRPAGGEDRSRYENNPLVRSPPAFRPSLCVSFAEGASSAQSKLNGTARLHPGAEWNGREWSRHHTGARWLDCGCIARRDQLSPEKLRRERRTEKGGQAAGVVGGDPCTAALKGTGCASRGVCTYRGTLQGPA